MNTPISNAAIEAAKAEIYESLGRPTGTHVQIAINKEIAELGLKLDHLLAHCKDGECDVCAKIICPHKDEMHFHHDGCPSCVGYEQVCAERDQLRAAIAVKDTVLSVYLNRAKSKLSCDSRSHDQSEIDMLERALSNQKEA